MSLGVTSLETSHASLTGSHSRQMRLRGHSPRTQTRCRHVGRLLPRHYHRSPARLSGEELQNWVLHLIRERKLSAATCPGAGHRLPCHLYASGEEARLFAKDSPHWRGNVDPVVWSVRRLYALWVFMPCGYLCPAGTGCTEPESERGPIHSHMSLDVESFTIFFFRQVAHVNNIPRRFSSLHNVRA